MSRGLQALSLVAIGTVLVAGCGSSSDGGDSSASSSSAESNSKGVEQESAQPRLAVSYDGGVAVLDATTLDQVATLPAEGFIRLNPAGDGRHVFVSESEGFRALDLGTWSRSHGDHDHYYTAEPALTDIRFGGEEPGHVVVHDDRTTLFSDGTGEIDIVEPAELLRGNGVAISHKVEPHHGVAVAREDGTTVVSVGNEDERTGVQILDADFRQIAANDQCPNLHGEAAVANGVLAFGCTDGILIVRGNEITKVQSPDVYGRIGNQAGSEVSPVVLGDYKVDEDAELERPTRVSLTNTDTGELKLVELGTSYTFRSLARGPQGEALVLGTDGAIHVIDPISGAVTDKIAVIGEWSEPEDWQEARPALYVEGSTAYVSDPTNKKLFAVDLGSGTVSKETTVDFTPNELTGVTG
nr:zinc metallochaperone AztD [Williamsia soli]